MIVELECYVDDMKSAEMVVNSVQVSHVVVNTTRENYTEWLVGIVRCG